MNSNDLKFADILSCSIRDVSNSLGIITSVLENAHSINFSPDTGNEVRSSVEDLLYEATRVHSDILQIYQLYQIDQNLYQINMDECDVGDFLEDQLLQNASLLEAQHISLNINGPQDLTWTFDQELMRGLMHNCLANAARYTKSAIEVNYKIIGDYLTITMADDSDNGYPKHVFITEEDCRDGFELTLSSIGLSVYYALRLAQLHQNGDKSGYVTVNNGGSLSGGCMGIHLP